MPTRVKTYSDADIVRIFCDHLDKQERKNIVVFFLVFSSYLFGKTDLFQFLDLLPFKRVAKFVAIVLAALNILQDIDEIILSRLFSGKMFKQVVRCLDAELRRTKKKKPKVEVIDILDPAISGLDVPEAGLNIDTFLAQRDRFLELRPDVMPLSEIDMLVSQPDPVSTPEELPQSQVEILLAQPDIPESFPLLRRLLVPDPPSAPESTIEVPAIVVVTPRTRVPFNPFTIRA